MTRSEWRELERLEKQSRSWPPRKGSRRQVLIEKSKSADEHPEWYNYACFCQTCMSYADA